MELAEAMKARHSVRSYTDRQIDDSVKSALLSVIADCNKISGLNIQLFLNEPKAFSGMKAHYGRFRNCRNYIAVVGKKGLDEAAGYYGEKVVLTAQALGLNSCWVAMTYSKGKVPCSLRNGEKLLIVIALGYGETQGTPHKSKPMSSLCNTDKTAPDWFRAGMEAVMLAPTAVNQQRFLFSLNGNAVSAKAFAGACTKIDLGIAKLHFELGARNDEWCWQK